MIKGLSEYFSHSSRKKRAFLTREDELLIRRLATMRSNGKWKKRGVTADEITEVFRKAGKNEDAIPAREVIERKISKYRRSDEPRPIDDPWSLGSLVDYPIPFDSLPIVLKGAGFGPITVRTAVWIARLYPLLQSVAIRKGFDPDYFKLKKTDSGRSPFDNPVFHIFGIAEAYSFAEWCHEVTNMKLDTWLYDNLFFHKQEFFNRSHKEMLQCLANLWKLPYKTGRKNQ